MTDLFALNSTLTTPSLPGGGPDVGCQDPEGLLAAYVVIIAVILTAILFAAVIFIVALLRAVAIHK